jgi:uncharacterized membrane protein YiaA
MNTWNIGVGIASVLSLLFHLSGKGAYLRQFTLPTTTALIGFTLGRNKADVEQTSNLFLQDPHLLFMFAVMLLLFGLAMYLVESTKPDAKISFIFLVFLSTIVVPQLLNSYKDIAPMISTQDYLSLARIREISGNTDEAIKYLKIYSKRVDKTLQKQVDEKIDTLRKQQFRRESGTKTKLPES